METVKQMAKPLHCTDQLGSIELNVISNSEVQVHETSPAGFVPLMASHRCQLDAHKGRFSDLWRLLTN